MKKIFTSLAFVALSSLAIISCSKGDYSSGDGQTGYNRFQDAKPTSTVSGNFTAKINGSQYTADNDKARAYSLTAGSTTTSWTIIGGKTSLESISVSINSGTLTKTTYDISTSDATILYSPVGGSSFVSGTSGSVTLTDISDTRLKGTFSMKATGLDITEGTFDVPITKY